MDHLLLTQVSRQLQQQQPYLHILSKKGSCLKLSSAIDLIPGPVKYFRGRQSSKQMQNNILSTVFPQNSGWSGEESTQ
jgi:hypothetical protein